MMGGLGPKSPVVFFYVGYSSNINQGLKPISGTDFKYRLKPIKPKSKSENIKTGIGNQKRNQKNEIPIFEKKSKLEKIFSVSSTEL